MSKELENDICTRGLVGEVEVRAINEDERSAEFVAATENGVDTYWGKEYLRMTGAKLARYRKNPVVLDTHDRWTVGSVIGRAEVKIEGKKLVCKVFFAKTERANIAWELVRTGFVRALSVGFIPEAKRIVRLAENEMDGDGEDAIKGPARIVKGWELFEISVVPVPADADALKRGYINGAQELAPMVRSLADMIERLGGAEKEPKMANENKTPETGAPENKGAETTAETRQFDGEKMRAETIRTLAPKALGERGAMLADTMILEGKTVEEARGAFLAELQKVAPPAGTPEPQQPEKKPAERKIDQVSEDTLVRTLTGF